VTCSRPHLENERQWNVNDCSPCIMVNHSVIWSVLPIYIVLTGSIGQDTQEHMVVPLWMKYVVTVWEDMTGISLTYLPIKAGISFFMDACDQMPLILQKRQEKNWWPSVSTHFQDGEQSVACSPFAIKAANTMFTTVCNLSPSRLLKIYN